MIDKYCIYLGTRASYWSPLLFMLDIFTVISLISALSNLFVFSYIFGQRKKDPINQSFLISAIAAGLDSAILDPLDKRIMSFVYASELLQGKDDYCMNYLAAFRQGKLEV